MLSALKVQAVVFRYVDIETAHGKRGSYQRIEGMKFIKMLLAERYLQCVKSPTMKFSEYDLTDTCLIFVQPWFN